MAGPTNGAGSEISPTKEVAHLEAHDGFGPGGTGSFDVTVRDTTGPTLDLPKGITGEATSSSGAAVSYAATAKDLIDGDREVSCTPTAGATFPLGKTTVRCSSSDARGNETTGTFEVTVEDTTGPTISGLPKDITTFATGPSGAAVTYDSPTATDLVDGEVSVACLPASDAVFPLGTARVECSASDSRGNATGESFDVSVLYEWAGFFSPVDNPNVLNDAKAGSAVPVKFSLGSDAGLDIFYEPPDEAPYPRSAEAHCDSGAPVDAIEQTITAKSGGLSYDAPSDRYK